MGASPLHLIPKKGRLSVRIRLVRSLLFSFLSEFCDLHLEPRYSYCKPFLSSYASSSFGWSASSIILLLQQTGALSGVSGSVRQVMEHAVLIEMQYQQLDLHFIKLKNVLDQITKRVPGPLLPFFSEEIWLCSLRKQPTCFAYFLTDLGQIRTTGPCAGGHSCRETKAAARYLGTTSVTVDESGTHLK